MSRALQYVDPSLFQSIETLDIIRRVGKLDSKRARDLKPLRSHWYDRCPLKDELQLHQAAHLPQKRV